MKSFLFLSCSLFLVKAFCAGILPPQVKLDKINAKTKEIKAELDANNDRLIGFNSRIAGTKALVTACVAAGGTAESCDRAQAGVNSNKEQIATFERAANKWREAIKGNEKELSSLDKDRNALIDPSQKQAVVDAKTDLASVKVDSALTGQAIVSAKVDVAQLGTDLDNSKMGKYVAAKTGLLLNSQLLCQSIDRCKEPNGVATKRVKPEQLKEVFPGLALKSFDGVDFWTKSRENRGISTVPDTATPVPVAPAATGARTTK